MWRILTQKLCSGFFDSGVVSFSTWLADDENTQGMIYWVQGRPGSGKSTLMKFAMADPRARDLLQKSETIPYVIAGFFFHDRGILIQKSTAGMLQELLHSTLVQATELGEFVQPIYSNLVTSQRTKTPNCDFQALKKAFEAIVMQRQVKARICLFLDALDEHHGDNEQLAALLHSLASSVDGEYVKIKICIASRPWDIFTVGFGNCPGFKIHEHASDDIRTYALSRLNQSSPKAFERSTIGDSRSERLETLARQVTEKANGVFIWVRIVVDEIAKGVRERVPFFLLEEKLSNMPEELKDLYEHTLERIEVEHTEEAYIMLQITLCAVSPLSLEAFVNATSFTLWGVLPPDREGTEEDDIQRVVSRSGGLLEVSKKTTTLDDIAQVREFSPPSQHSGFTVQFLHQTVKEYIQARDDNFGLRRVRSGGTGFQYLLDVIVGSQETWTHSLALDVFEYARCMQSTGLDSQKEHMELRLLQLVDLESVSRVPFEDENCHWIDWWIDRKVGGDSQNGFWRFMKKGIPKQKLMNLALAAGLFEFFRRNYLGPYLNKSTRAYMDFPFMIMAVTAPKITSRQVTRREMLSLLFELGIDADCTIERYARAFDNSNYPRMPPLAVLITNSESLGQDESERVSAIECLLEAGADPNMPLGLGDDSETIFSRCIKQENTKVIRLLGKHGAHLQVEEGRQLSIGILNSRLWGLLQRPSRVFMEVIEISRRNQNHYSMTHSLRDPDAASPRIGSSTALESVSALAASGALTAIAHGASWYFRRCLTAKERWRFAMSRTMWIQNHRLASRNLTTFEDVVIMAMRSRISREMERVH